MSTLKIQIDLDRLPDGVAEPNEASVILRELADWLERRKEWKEPTGTGKVLRNFESQPCGNAWITE